MSARERAVQALDRAQFGMLGPGTAAERAMSAIETAGLRVVFAEDRSDDAAVDLVSVWAEVGGINDLSPIRQREAEAMVAKLVERGWQIVRADA